MTNDNTGIFRGYMIVTDLDGTFFGPHAARIERNIEAVKRFTAGGGIFTVATGRSS
ncbi:MAG: HAD hydrolase family protein, partial [Clostridia bacterium]|nr:HAD hydrolase family protein [Clostridia bacterium]